MHRCTDKKRERVRDLLEPFPLKPPEAILGFCLARLLDFFER